MVRKSVEDANEEVMANSSFQDVWNSFFRKYRSLTEEAASITSPAKQAKHLYDAFYMNEINAMMAEQKETLFVNFEHLNDAISLGQIITGETVEESNHTLSNLVKLVLTDPERAARSAVAACSEILRELHPDYFKEIHARLAIGFTEFDIHVEIPNINHTQIDQLMTMEGFVTKVDDATRVLYITTTWVCAEDHENVVEGIKKPTRCLYCSKGIKQRIKSMDERTDVQEFEIQQRWDRVEEGKMAAPITVRAVGKEMVQQVWGGEFVEVVGILRVKEPTKDTDIGTYYLEASSIKHKSDDMFLDIFQKKTAFLEDQVRHAVRRETEEQDYQRLIDSIAPSVYGCREEKEALLLQMIGCKGPLKLPDDQTLRGNLSIFFCGDPGTAKSVLARAAMLGYRRSMYVNAQAVTKVGLTASISRVDGVSKLEPGVYLLTRGGLVVIDELQLLDKVERGALLQVMDDDQKITVAKGGSKTIKPLRADCSTTAMGNPINGRWDRTKNIFENTGLRPENISRFDLIFVFTDLVNDKEDWAKTEHWLKNASKGIPIDEYEHAGEAYIKQIQRIEDEGIIHTPQYMAYLMRFLHKEVVPNVVWDWSDPAVKKLQTWYHSMRKVDGNLFAPSKEDIKEGKEPMKIPSVGMRQLGSLIRLACASAAGHFRTRLTEVDADKAINLMQISLARSGFVGSEQISGKQYLELSPAKRNTLREFDILRMAEKNRKFWLKDADKKAKRFEDLVKQYGFRGCGDCQHLGIVMHQDGKHYDCIACEGRGGRKEEFSINDIYAHLTQERWTTREVEDMIEVFKKVGALEQSPRHPAYMQLHGEWYHAMVKSWSYVDKVKILMEEQLTGEGQGSETNIVEKPRMPTAYDMYNTSPPANNNFSQQDSEQSDEAYLQEAYQNANPLEMNKYEEILRQATETPVYEDDIGEENEKALEEIALRNKQRDEEAEQEE